MSGDVYGDDGILEDIPAPERPANAGIEPETLPNTQVVGEGVPQVMNLEMALRIAKDPFSYPDEAIIRAMASLAKRLGYLEKYAERERKALDQMHQNPNADQLDWERMVGLAASITAAARGGRARAYGGLYDGSPVTPPQEIRFVIDGPPGHESGRFVEVEDETGASIRVGEWHLRPDGLWELRVVSSIVFGG